MVNKTFGGALNFLLIRLYGDAIKLYNLKKCPITDDRKKLLKEYDMFQNDKFWNKSMEIRTDFYNLQNIQISSGTFDGN